jgi:hypothetical protein
MVWFLAMFAVWCLSVIVMLEAVAKDRAKQQSAYRTPDVLDVVPGPQSLKPFVLYRDGSYESERCVKCGAGRVMRWFGSGRAVRLSRLCTGKAGCSETRKHFHVSCRSCGGMWLMATKDSV